MSSYKFKIALIFISAISSWAQTDSAYNLRITKINSGLNNIFRSYQYLVENHLSDVDPELLADEAIKGMANSLDKFTEFLYEENFKSYDQLLKTSYVGIGIGTFNKDTTLYIDEVLDNTPAKRAGFKVGDRIYKIDGVLIDKSNYNNKFSGEDGSEVKYTVIRGFKKLDTLELICKRQKITEHSLNFYTLINDSIAYIQLKNFSVNSKDEIKNSYLELKRKSNDKLVGLILDLRENGGGLLQSAYEIFELFEPVGTYFGKIENKYGKTIDLYTKNSPIDTKIPIALIVNGNTASASEFLAVAFQDYSRAKIIGSSTVGKGISQVIKNLSGKKALKITTDKFVSPKGREINKINYLPSFSKVSISENDTIRNEAGAIKIVEKGIVPDIKVAERKFSPLIMELVNKEAFANFANDYKYKITNKLPSDSDTNLFREFKLFAMDSFRDSNLLINYRLEEIKKYYDDNTISSKMDEIKDIINNYFINSFDNDKTNITKFLNYEIMMRNQSKNDIEEFLIKDDNYILETIKHFGLNFGNIIIRKNV